MQESRHDDDVLMSCLLVLLEGIEMEMSRIGEAGNEKNTYNGFRHTRPPLLQLTDCAVNTMEVKTVLRYPSRVCQNQRYLTYLSLNKMYYNPFRSRICVVCTSTYIQPSSTPW